MSETPAPSTTDERATRELDNTNLSPHSDDVSHHFERWARDGVTVLPRYDMPEQAFNLHSDDTLNADLWTSKEEYQVPVQAIERIEEARRPLTRAQEVERPLLFLTDKELLQYAVLNTKAVWALKHLI